MPSVSKKQHNLMEAVAHNRSFAKRVGIPQSVGKDYVAADKGKKFAFGGMAKIGKQDTRHGKVDMPFNKLNRLAGMWSGGSVKKVKRFAEGGIDDATRQRALEYAARNQMGVEPEFNLPSSSKASTKPAAKPRAAASTSEDDEGRTLGKFKTDSEKAEENAGERHLRSMRAPAAPTRTTKSGETESGAVTGRTMKIRPRLDTDSPEYERQREELLDRGTTVLGAMAGPGLASVARPLISAGNTLRASQIASVAKHRKLVEMGKRGREAQAAARAERKAESAYDARRAADMEAGFKKGGSVESKAMVKKEVGFMKKKGAPASMIKHEMAEMKGMKKGGMMRPKKDIAADQMAMAPYRKGGAMKYARGGSIKEVMGPRGMGSDVEKGSNVKRAHGEHGIQKRGHTRGMEEKMAGGPKKFAAGGAIRAHGEHGIQLKGHTRGKVC